MKIPVEVRPKGLYCSAGDFYIDAWDSVPVCLITHAHSDHARRGHGLSIACDDSFELLKYRLGSDTPLQTYPYREKFKYKNCWVSFHPAGHVLGSAQVRIETEDHVCVISGDYKRGLDPTCPPFEVVPCDTFVTESTFALPIYQWEPSEVTAQKILTWWQENRAQGLCSILYGYSLGKAQRMMALLGKLTQEPVYLHGAVLPLAQIYVNKGIPLIPFLPIDKKEKKSFAGELIIAPPSARGSPWERTFQPFKTGYASGWLQVRGVRKQRNVDRGFVLSDHADWPDLLRTVRETGASTILTTHGNSAILAKFIKETGTEARPLHGTEKFDEGEE